MGRFTDLRIKCDIIQMHLNTEYTKFAKVLHGPKIDIIPNSEKLDTIYYYFTLMCLKKFLVDIGLNSQ